MTDANPDPNGTYEPAQHDDSGDYNPESIDYEAQDNESAQEGDYASEDEHHFVSGYVEAPSHLAGQPPQSPTTTRSPIATHSPIAARSPSASRPPIVARQYDALDPQEPVPMLNTNDRNSADIFKSPPAGDIVDNPTMHQQTATDAPQEASALPKSVDLQALLAGLVPARTKISDSPPQPREKPGLPSSQSYPPAGPPPPPALNIPPDIMYHLQSLTSPPSQTAPQFQQTPPQQQRPPQPSGPIDIQPDDLALSPEEEILYEKFLQNEREVVQNARWDEFPPGSRMFIGNLPSDRIGKKDIFRLFYPYGRLAQISIKQAYGFVQFYDKADCDTAIHAQQGMILTGRKVHLEISKPQKQKDSDKGRGRRDRSPLNRDRDRSPPSGRGRGRTRGKGYDDFESRGRAGSRDFSPPSGRYRHDDDDRGRRYSRSRSPVGRYPASPPRRPPEPPEVAILVKDEPERGYVNYIEDMFGDRFRIDTLFLSPRASIPDLTRQLVVDGVLAIVTLSRSLQDRRRVAMQTFQRNPADPGAVKWDEYNEIDVHTAIDLVTAIKRGRQPQTTPVTRYPPQQYPQPPQPPTLPSGVNPNLANIIGNMDPAGLQRVLSAIAQQPAPQSYGGFSQPGVQGAVGQPALQGFGGQRQTQPTQQVQDIMAQLAALTRKG